MKSRILTSTLCVFALPFVSSACASAQDGMPLHFSGVINDYSVATVKGGPWEMHGQWSLNLHEESSTADFSADMTMSDFATSAGVVDAAQPGQNAHTHHIKLTGAKVIWDMVGCPTFSPPAKMGFRLSKTVSLLTGNGSIAPFEPDPPVSTLEVCVTGGDDVPYSVPNSNITLVFAGPATTHFGTQAIHGVVRTPSLDGNGKD